MFARHCPFLDTCAGVSVIIVEFNDGDLINVGLEVYGSVTYEFQSLEYDTCTQTLILAECAEGLCELPNFNVSEQMTDEGVQ